jgi:aminomethyltransferase
LGRFIKLDAAGFIGAEAVAAAKQQGLDSALVGFELLDKGVARAEYLIEKDGQEVGIVTSGAPSPALSKSIGLAYVTADLADPGTELDVIVRGRALRAKVVSTPFL